MLVLTYYIPRSKRWLLLQGYREEAYESMRFVYKGDIEEAFQHLAAQIEPSPNNNTTTSFNDEEIDDDALCSPPSLCSREYRAAMIASVGLITFQQFSGQPSVLSYATVLFQAAGWSGNASVVTSILMMMTSICTVLLVDRVGRKRLLATCCVVMTTALAALSSSFWGWDDQGGDGVDDNPFGTTQKLVILIAMFVYIGGYQVGFGPITWCVVSEIFPMEIRGKALAFGVELNYLLNFLVQFTFPMIHETLGWGPTFLLFGILLAVCFFFIHYFVPETTGLTLEQIQLKLSQRGGEYNNNDDGEADSYYFPTERSTLLPDQAPLLGAMANLEEMETQMIRTHSGTALADKYYKP
jgi:MFS family permease